MASVAKLIENAITEYEKWATNNPNALGEVETALKCFSYTFTSQFASSNLLSELIYSLSKLLTFYNDQIIYKKVVAPNTIAPNAYENKLKKWLSIIGHCEVFIELSAYRVTGTYGKWIIIFVLQTFKSIIRLFLLLKEDEQMVETSPIYSLDRRNIQEFIRHGCKHSCVKLKNGRMIKTVGAYSVINHKWDVGSENIPEKVLDKYQKNAEILYIMKPLIHLGCMYFWGQKSWKPWILSFLIDIGSLHMLTKIDINEKQKFSERQRREIIRRMYMLFMYAMRSPFYDMKTKNYLIASLNNMARLPFFGIFFKSLNEYLPAWQETYFYIWSP